MSLLIREDNVRETSTTTGTGNFALAGALIGYRAFDDVCANGDTCPYLIRNDDVPTEWEVGLGTFNDTDTLARSTVQASSNAGGLVNFSAGTKEVMLVHSAAEAKRAGYALQFSGGLQASPADGVTMYYGTPIAQGLGSAGLVRTYIPRAGTIRLAYFNAVVAGTLGDTATGSAYIRKNSTTDYLISSAVQWNTLAQFYSAVMEVPVAVGDYIEMKLVYPTWATTNPTNVINGGHVWIE